MVFRGLVIDSDPLFRHQPLTSDHLLLGSPSFSTVPIALCGGNSALRESITSPPLKARAVLPRKSMFLYFPPPRALGPTLPRNFFVCLGLVFLSVWLFQGLAEGSLLANKFPFKVPFLFTNYFTCRGREFMIALFLPCNPLSIRFYVSADGGLLPPVTPQPKI